MRAVLPQNTRDYGFCYSVEDAMQMLNKALEKAKSSTARGNGKWVVVYRDPPRQAGPIIREYRRQEAPLVEFSEKLDPSRLIWYVPPHGTGLPKAGLNVIVYNATCPKIREQHERARGWQDSDCQMVFIGTRGGDQARAFVESIGQEVVVIEKPEEVADIQIADRRRLCVMSQLSFLPEDSEPILEALRNQYPQTRIMDQRETCYTVLERKREAQRLAQRCGLVLVIGDPKSHHGRTMVRKVENLDRPAFLIRGPSEITPKMLEECKDGQVGVISTTATPRTVVEEVVRFINATEQ